MRWYTPGVIFLSHAPAIFNTHYLGKRKHKNGNSFMCSLLTLRTYTYRHIDRFQYVNIFVHMPDIFMYVHFVSIWSTSINDFIWSTWIKMYVNRDTPEYVY